MSPRWTFNMSSDYRRPLPFHDWTGFMRLEYLYRSSVYGAQNLDVKTRQAGFALVNGRVGIETEDGLQVELWARNLFDKNWITLSFGTPGIGGGVPGQAGSYSGFVGKGRMYGLRVAKRY